MFNILSSVGNFSLFYLTDIPSLPDNSPVAEAEAFVRLIAHFEGTRNPAMLGILFLIFPLCKFEFLFLFRL